MNSQIIINQKRSNHIENKHFASAVVYKGDKIIYSKGDENLILTWRSTAKPFMLIPLIKEGISKYNLTNDEITVMCSSHNGEEVHRKAVKSILNKIGATEKDIVCEAHAPYFEWNYKDFSNEEDIDKKRLYHNCSGKHSAMLLMCKLYGFPTDNYWEKEHPVQQMILKEYKKFIQITDNEYFDIGVDGCGVPTYFTSLKRLAHSYRLFSVKPEVEVIRNAILDEPYYIAGKDRVESAIIDKCNFIAKNGTDGVFCISIKEEEIGIAIKIEDGSDIISRATIVGLLNHLGFLSENEKEYLETFVRSGIEFVF
jgi:L-asparaginase II